MTQSVHHAAPPPRHRDPAPPTPYRRRDWAAVAVVGALLGAFVHGLMAYAGDCEELECIGTGLTAIAAGVVLVPAGALLGVTLLRVPAAARVALAGVVVGLAFGTTVAMLDAAVRGLAPGSQPVPLWLMVVAGAASGPAGVVLGGRGFQRAQRVGVVLGAGMVLALASMPLSGR